MRQNFISTLVTKSLFVENLKLNVKRLKPTLLNFNQQQKRNINIGTDSTLHKTGTFYYEKVIIGYSREQMCSLVSDVAKYKEFVPFCINSTVLDNNISNKTNNHIKPNRVFNLRKMKSKKEETEDEEIDTKVLKKQLSLPSPNKTMNCQLDIGYPPIRESYTCQVSILDATYVKAVARNTHIFEYLKNEWKFHDVPLELIKTSNPQSNKSNKCFVEFYVAFNFHSSLYNQFAHLFLDKIFSKMVIAFTERAKTLYGPPSMPSKILP
jgi:coenzyme Q-binding protein COQ10